MTTITDISPADCYAALQSDPRAVLLDVRTPPEWSFVGVPVTPNLAQISLTLFPPTQPDPDFLPKVEAKIAKDQPVYCLCKLGGRSQAAAQMLASAGYENVFNIVHGFDGDHNAHGQRRSVNGWVAAGLPWQQA